MDMKLGYDPKQITLPVSRMNFIRMALIEYRGICLEKGLPNMAEEASIIAEEIRKQIGGKKLR